eukprot:CAMPEP_0119426748 /NCGR_PEP_ID=MMETSP1335-20130426/36938_1 /TAXON_ID=259385 /ORGANISM="Chrysoculter rhomboideus, Strain RCC1486" /LENGTH=75 /DNA_ID=CAMNT_0007452353 /DNA_START=27 /DNA_END=251 /DNA_ORIENTATION=+
MGEIVDEAVSTCYYPQSMRWCRAAVDQGHFEACILQVVLLLAGPDAGTHGAREAAGVLRRACELDATARLLETPK